eukprot:TRINITY_DN6072_c0_g1_i1.p1 TRINITY_DN6072_c0_g1~~TRINITY_DN6072_c0_g1_i1.p1  ORF type:complete len:551 (+),score=120.57 TRINITY_DN6072_c0_g1_i1:106-1653(+)
MANAADCPPIATVADLKDGDTAWVIAASALVLLMTPGLAFFYGGLVRKKNVVNTLMMSYVAMGVIMIHWAFCGYSFAFGPGGKGFGSFKWGGLRHVGGAPNPDYSATIPHLAYSNYQMMFAVITPALISGGVVERMHFRSYILYIIIWTTVVYDPLAHWLWSSWSDRKDDGTCEFKMGWLKDMGAIDFAGGMVVHTSSGFSALIASYIVGKRRGLDPQQGVQPSNVPFVLLGAGLLWFGWLGFNGGSSLAADAIAINAAMSTSLAAAAGFLTWMMLDSITGRKPSAVGAATGSVIGLIGITPGAGYVFPGFSILFGFFSVIFAYGSIRLKGLLRVDDSLDVFFCHGVGGAVGTLMTGLFATKQINPNGPDGAFYGNPKQFGLQLLAVVVTIGLSTIATAIVLLVFKYTPIGLRTNAKWEEDGMDATIHKEEAFEEVAMERMKLALNRRTTATGKLGTEDAGLTPRGINLTLKSDTDLPKTDDERITTGHSERITTGHSERTTTGNSISSGSKDSD